MSFSAAQQEEIADAQRHAGELLELFRAWVPKRRATVRQLRGIADELRSVSTGVNAGRFVGTLLESRCEKTGLRGFRPGLTQTGLYSHRRWLEA